MQKVALVTGGMGGLGTAICKELSKLGFNVVTTYSGNEEKAKRWFSQMNDAGFNNCKAYKCDVSDYNSCCELSKQIEKDIGVIDVLVNNAGITRDATFRKMTKENWDAVLRTNLDSMFNLTKQVIDGMLEKSWGRIINISSINGQKGQFGQTNYSAAKAGVHGFTMALAQEVARKGITVNTIAPGYIATDMVMAMPDEVREKITAAIPVGRLGKPDEIGALVGYLVSDMAGFMTGAELAINGGQFMM